MGVLIFSRALDHEKSRTCSSLIVGPLSQLKYKIRISTPNYRPSFKNKMVMKFSKKVIKVLWKCNHQSSLILLGSTYKMFAPTNLFGLIQSR